MSVFEPGPLVLEATVMSNVPQPLPTIIYTQSTYTHSLYPILSILSSHTYFIYLPTYLPTYELSLHHYCYLIPLFFSLSLQHPQTQPFSHCPFVSPSPHLLLLLNSKIGFTFKTFNRGRKRERERERERHLLMKRKKESEIFAQFLRSPLRWWLFGFHFLSLQIRAWP